MRCAALFRNQAPQVGHPKAEEQSQDDAHGKGDDQTGKVRKTGPTGEASGHIEKIRRSRGEQPADVRRTLVSRKEHPHPKEA